MTPLLFIWDGEAMEPLARHRARADKQYVIGETYCLVPEEQRSSVSHRHYFSALHQAWSNLPEDVAGDFVSDEHLRKYALIQVGYRDERSIVCASKAEAARVAAFIRPMDEFAVVLVHEAMVRVFTAKSQSVRAMGKKDFQDSKQKVLDYVAAMVGVAPAELAANAEAA